MDQHNPASSPTAPDDAQEATAIAAIATAAAGAVAGTPPSPSGRASGALRARTPLVAQLDREWQRLHAAPRALATARSWVRPGSAHPLDVLLAGDRFDDLDQIVAAVQRGRLGPAGDDDAILLRLVELAHVDELAGRIVVQRLLPGLVVHARRFHGADIPDPIAAAVTAAWVAIRSYATDRRPRHVAASLLSDTLFQAFRKPLRRRRVDEVPTPSETLEAIAWQEPPRPALVELADVVRDASIAGVAARELELIRALVQAGSPTVVAIDRKVTTRTVRNHRDRAVRLIREAVAA